MLSELPLMDKAFHDPAVLDRPVGERDGAGAAHARHRRDASPTSSSGSSHCTAVLVLDGGHPVGILTRSDVLTFLAGAGTARKDSMTDGFETRAIHDGQDPDPGDRRGRAADHPLVDVRARGRWAKHAGFEYARSGNPTRARVRGVPGVARRRDERLRVRERHGGRGRGAAAARARRSA